MNKQISYVLMLIVAFAAASCERVIDVDLDDAEKRIVIEGVVTNQAGTCKVLVSQSKSFDDANDFAGISGATVSITGQDGLVTALTESSAGVYVAPSLEGMPGKTYTLMVQLNGDQYTATSTMPQPVTIDTLYAKDDNLFSETRKIVNVQYADPSGKGNRYRFIQFVNGIKEKEIFIRDDDLSDGNVATISLRYDDDDDGDNELQPGDQIRIDMLCIDERVYKYWYSLERGSLGNNWGTPANPVTNITGGALGYFSAHTLDSGMMVVP